MVDVISNDDLLMRKQNAANVREALKRADLALENSRIPDITDLDMTILSGLLAGVNMGQILTINLKF